MFTYLQLERPLAIIDLETTGTDPEVDRIVELSVLKVNPDGGVDHRTRRVNPGIPIPPEATAVHGIRDEDVAKEVYFTKIAAGLVTFLEGTDLCGYNILGFDLKVLIAEFRRAHVHFSFIDRVIIDPMRIYHLRERRDLSSAVRFYCGVDHEGAHGAASDVIAAARVLDAMLARYPDLPKRAGDLRDSLRDQGIADLGGCFRLLNGRLLFNFGKHKGRYLDEVAAERPDYLRWMMEANFYDDARELARLALESSRRSPVPA